MVDHKLYRLVPAGSLILLVFIIWIASGQAHGQTLYEYLDKDGTLIITDSPPPGVNVKKSEPLPVMTEEQKTASEKESSEKLQRYREADAKRKEREGNIRVAREELEKAKKDEESYRANMNQASGYVQRHYWRTLVDAQLNLIDEKKKKLEELESSP
jgi:Domain of unknown function (DUF4124)